jgi:hypothetical protein
MFNKAQIIQEWAQRKPHISRTPFCIFLRT